jgi:ribosomal protein S12 methylthiotransferase
MQFDRLGAFAFSPEKGTAAYSMRNRPSRAIAEEREKIIMQDAEKLWGVRSKKMLGATVKALVVAPGVARMASQAPDVDGVVYLLDSKKARKAAIGDFVNIKLSRVCGFDFEADVE